MHLTNAIRNAQFSVTRITVARITAAQFTVADFTDPTKSGCWIYRCPIFRLPSFPLPTLPLPSLPFTSLTIVEQEISRDLLAFLIQSPADFHHTRQNDWCRQGKWTHDILEAIQNISGSESGLIRKSIFFRIPDHFRLKLNALAEVCAPWAQSSLILFWCTTDFWLTTSQNSLTQFALIFHSISQS